MFDNIGGKIKALASVVCWVGIIASVIYSFVLIGNEVTAAGILCLFLGPLASWIGSFVLYGFGQLVENSDVIARQYRNGKASESESDASLETISVFKEENASESYSEYFKAELNGFFLDFKCPTCGKISYISKADLTEMTDYTCTSCHAKFPLKK